MRVFKSKETALAWGAAFAAMAAWSWYDNKKGSTVSDFDERDEWNKKIKDQEKQRKH
ncbi:unnamed protein product [Hapterophycus canaliculatus]